jgi:hypothetical protein
LINCQIDALHPCHADNTPACPVRLLPLSEDL